jgi:hypothetical protein
MVDQEVAAQAARQQQSEPVDAPELGLAATALWRMQQEMEEAAAAVERQRQEVQLKAPVVDLAVLAARQQQQEQEVAAAAVRKLVQQEQEEPAWASCEYDPDYYDEELEAGHDCKRPQHLACYNMVDGVVVATSEMVPVVYSFPEAPAPMGVTFRASPKGPSLSVKRAILDTGANVVLASRQWVERSGLQWQQSKVLQLRTSSGGTFEACGRLSQPLIVVFCAGTPEELKVAVDCHVMTDKTELYELLLGTPLVNAVGGEISSYHSSFIYHPQLHVEGGDTAATHSVPICTYTDRAGAAYKESNRFLLGAVRSWFD